MDKLTQAIECAKSGDKAKAKQLLAEAIQVEPNNETAWLWMAGVIGEIDQQIYCLKQALRINPNNQSAAAGLAKLTTLKNQSANQVKQDLIMETPPLINPAPVSLDNALPLPDISKWSHGFREWSILETAQKARGAAPELGLLIGESSIAQKRIFGWAALFVLIAVGIGILAIVIGENPLIPAGIAFLFLCIALYRVGTWYRNKDLKAEIFREGLTFKKGDKSQVIFWREIDYVKEKWEKMVYQGIIHVYTHKIEIRKADGQSLTLDRSLEKVEAIGRWIQLAVADHLLTARVEQLKNNQECDFGIFTISRSGIKYKNKFLPWESVKALEVYTTGRTTIKVMSVDSKLGMSWAMENGGGVKNLQLFLDLAYWFIQVARLPAAERIKLAAPSQETDNGDVYYGMPVTKVEARDGVQKVLYVGIPLNERQLVVRVPAGVQPGTVYRFPSYGRSIPGNSTAGTLTVEIVVEQVTPLQKRLEEIQILVGILLMIAGMIWLSMDSSLDLISSLLAASLIGCAAGALIALRRRVIGAVSGAIGGVIYLVLQFVYYVVMYVAFGRESFWNYEMGIVSIVSALPGLGIYTLLNRVIKPKQSHPDL